MNRFQIPSPILDLQKTTHSFMLENVTMNPFNEVTTEQDDVVESQENNGLFIIIYGIGGALIFFAVATICYGLCMPSISDEAYARFEERNRQNLRERVRLARLERERNQNDVENPMHTTQELENPPNGTRHLPNVNRTEPTRPSESGTQESSDILPQRDDRPITGVIRDLGSAFRSHTAPKQLREDQQNTPQKNENLRTTLKESKDVVTEFSISEEYEDHVSSSKDVSDKFKTISSTNQLHEQTMLLDKDPCEKDTLMTSSIFDSVLMPMSPEGRSQSSPTSPDIIRRRFSSQDTTPRRSSSLR